MPFDRCVVKMLEAALQGRRHRYSIACLQSGSQLARTCQLQKHSHSCRQKERKGNKGGPKPEDLNDYKPRSSESCPDDRQIPPSPSSTDSRVMPLKMTWPAMALCKTKKRCAEEPQRRPRFGSPALRIQPMALAALAPTRLGVCF